ncbi:GFA family protein [Aurantiacibacter spongiae]|uniref:Aldehyde-activating protein n=1 Tax=Aurantiacibacter spongiae TaxID=2488860 RepID=A0A3N5CNU2_9SPHN|nr:GFA family protein [Aurantiacibacter spongiae]RPF70614.1 aldehyde-activating protein [Aurantiacibacter spongiae]
MEARCQCGGLSATIADDARAMTVLCHCLDCQRLSGSAFGVMAYYPREAVVLRGPSREYTRTTDDGNGFASGFCPHCGSTVYAFPGKYPDMIGISLGALADPAFPRPARSVYERSRHDWVHLPADMPRHPMGRET